MMRPIIIHRENVLSVPVNLVQFLIYIFILAATITSGNIAFCFIGENSDEKMYISSTLSSADVEKVEKIEIFLPQLSICFSRLMNGVTS